MKINHPVTDREVMMKEDTILVTKTDLKGRIIFANDAFVEISGFSRDELIGANHNIVRHPDMPPEAFEDLWNTINKGLPWRNLVKNRTKSGDYYWVEAHVSGYFEKGQLSGYVSCRYAPSREQIRAAEFLYEQIRSKKAKLRNVTLLDKINPLKRLTLAGKMACLAILLLLPGIISLSMLNHDKNAAIEFAEKEIKGIEYLSAVKPLLAQLTEHRTNSNTFFLNNNRDDDSVMQIGKKVSDTIKSIDSGVEARLSEEFKTAEHWEKIKADWETLQKQGLQQTAENNFSQHSELIEQVNELMVHVSDQSNLTLDPDVDSFYMMTVVSIRLPELIDHVNELRSVANRVAKAGTELDQQSKIQIAVLDQHINERFGETEHDLAAVFEKNPAIKSVISGKQEKFSEDLKKFTDSVKQDIYLSQDIKVPAEQIFSLGTAAIRSLDDLYDEANPQLKSIIEKRIEGLQQAKLVQLGLVVFIIIAVGIIGYFMIRNVTGSIKQVVATFLNISNGQFRNLVDLEGRDEIGDLWRKLETMQVALNVDISNTRELATKAIRVERALENVSSSVMVANNNLDIIFMNKSVERLFKNAEADIRKELPEFNASNLMGANIDQFHKNPAHQRGLLANLTGSHSGSLEIGGRHMDIVANPVKDTDGNRIGTVVEWVDRTREVKIEREIEEIVNYVKVGRLDKRLALTDKHGFFAKLSEGINELTDVIERVFKDVGSTMESMAEGDLTNRINSDYQGVYLNCKNDINATIDKLSEIFGKVNESASFINNSSQEIASGNNNLSQRAEQQAANLQETAASMEELTSTVKNNADNAQQANVLASNARELAEKGGSVVTAAVSAMQEINESSNKIADIIGVIDEIAFQTNLLALNASVEAARAGEQGRGFSVVATEVRNLAQRSATAARESKELIQNSVQKVRAGSEFVNQTGNALSEIVMGVKKVGDIVAAIASASVEQSAGIAQVNQAVSQMDEITQQNAALAEEASAASVSMSDLSTNMVELLSFFKTEKKAASNPNDLSNSHITRVAETPKSTSASGRQTVYRNVASDDDWQDF
jgi:methyl-accepting chemotaxis protein